MKSWDLTGRGANTFPCDRRTDNALKARFRATQGEESEVEVALV
jgi:hypothetical protein